MKTSSENTANPSASPSTTLRVLLVDDEPLARARLRSLLTDIDTPATHICGEAATAAQAIEQINASQPQVLLLDIHMPGMDGMELAQRLQNHHRISTGACQIIFVTASSEHALQAFDVAAADYLTKPVRSQRLQLALHKAAAQLAAAGQQPAPAPTTSAAPASLLLQERDQSQRLPLAEILYARAEQKYVTLRTRNGGELLWDGSLSQLEDQHPQHFVRIHRNTLAQRQAMRQLKLCPQSDGSEGWLLQLESCTEWLPVSRRQLPVVRQALQNL